MLYIFYFCHIISYASSDTIFPEMFYRIQRAKKSASRVLRFSHADLKKSYFVRVFIASSQWNRFPARNESYFPSDMWQKLPLFDAFEMLYIIFIIL